MVADPFVSEEYALPSILSRSSTDQLTFAVALLIGIKPGIWTILDSFNTGLEGRGLWFMTVLKENSVDHNLTSAGADTRTSSPGSFGGLPVTLFGSGMNVGAVTPHTAGASADR